MRILSALTLLLAAHAIQAQPADALPPDTLAAPRYGTGAGGSLLLTNSGFGVGGYAAVRVGPLTSLVAELSLSGVRDERETKFFGYGGPTIQNKAHYLLVVPLRLGAFHRLFRKSIEDNFRPYVHASVGPTLGWVSPYFDDCNGNRQFDRSADCNRDGAVGPDEGEREYDAFSALPRGHAEMGVGGQIALGAHFGYSTRVSQGLQIAYRFDYFPDAIALLEPRIKKPQQFFGTPVVSFTFGRLF